MCYIYLEDEDSGVTVYEILMPIIRRIKPTAGTYTPEQIDNFTTLLNQLNALIDTIDDTNAESELINEEFQEQVDRMSVTSFYVDPADGNLYAGG